MLSKDRDTRDRLISAAARLFAAGVALDVGAHLDHREPVRAVEVGDAVGVLLQLVGGDVANGIDVGFQRRGVIVWAVLSPGLTNGPGSLSGNYVGLSADVAAGLGAGANALIC